MAFFVLKITPTLTRNQFVRTWNDSSHVLFWSHFDQWRGKSSIRIDEESKCRNRSCTIFFKPLQHVHRFSLEAPPESNCGDWRFFLRIYYTIYQYSTIPLDTWYKEWYIWRQVLQHFRSCREDWVHQARSLLRACCPSHIRPQGGNHNISQHHLQYKERKVAEKKSRPNRRM